MIVAAVMLMVPLKSFGFQATASVNQNRISVEDTVLLNVVVEGGSAQIDVSGIRDFEIISRGTSRSMSFVNGHMARKTTYQFMLAPLGSGELAIPALKVTKDGEDIFTQPIRIHVAQQKEDVGKARAIFTKASISKAKLYVGEQVVYTLDFYTSRQLGGLGFEKLPEFENFSVQPFEKQQQSAGVINGIQYEKTTVNFLLIPKKEGKFTLPPVTLIAKVIVEAGRQSQFDSIFNDSILGMRQYRPVRISSNRIDVTVQALPPYTGKEPFSGLLGEFDITSTLDPVKLKAGDAATLTIKISGKGNIRDAGTPALDLDTQHFKVYNDTPAESIELTLEGYQGFKAFKKAIVPVKAGNFTLDPVKIVYFDTRSGTYKKIETPAAALEVAASQVSTAPPVTFDSSRQPPEKNQVRFENRDIFDIRESHAALKPWRHLSGKSLGAALAVPFILLGCLWILSQVRPGKASAGQKMRERAKKQLQKAARSKEMDDQFLGHLQASLTSLILSRAGKKGQNITMEEVRETLSEQGAKPDDIETAVSVFRTIESVRFGPSQIDDNKAKDLLKNVRHLFKVFGIIVFCVISFTLFQKDLYAQTPASLFDEGIQYYRSQEYAKAAETFEKSAEKGVCNPSLYYNIGNAWLKAGQVGKAVLWYERAKRLAPSDPDLKFNLAHARTLVKDQAEASDDIFETLFFWERMVRFFWVQTVLIGISILFCFWAGIRIWRRQSVFAGPGNILAALFVMVSFVTVVHYYMELKRPFAVIVEKEAAVRSGTSPSAVKLFTLHEGSKVRVVDRKNGHVKIMFSKEKKGWIDSRKAVMIQDGLDIK